MNKEAQEIEQLKTCFVEQLSPERIYLFGSFANGTYKDDSDYDFYIIMNDECSDLVSLTSRAYRSVRDVKQRPVDIIVGTKSRFESRKELSSVENEVFRKGILLYDKSGSFHNSYESYTNGLDFVLA